ncbi:MAG: hypothetical protein RL274_2782 [Pseudomonadota bacterium]|jgi:excisionase family DNA binding protein
MADNFEPISVTVAEACRVTGLGKTKLYELMKDGVVTSAMVGGRRIVQVASLKALVGASVGLEKSRS